MRLRSGSATPWLAWLCLVITFGCGGGGGGGGPTEPPPPPGINFTPAGPATPGSCFLKEDSRTSASKLFLEVRVNEVTDWYGVAFDLLYPSNLLSYLRVKEGGFPGGNTTLEIVEVGPGHLVVGHTKLGNVPGRSGSGLLMTLEFLPQGNGSGQFTFDNEQAFRTNSFPLAVDFIAGSVSVSL